jgi:His/Glu/Gln/Arg/opine family amino acid ABC transporter permease subunit
MLAFATTYHWDLIWQNRGALLNGLLIAGEVASVALVVSLAVGLLLAVVRMSPRPWCWIATAYINIFRGLPALVSAIWVYFGLSLALHISLSVFQAGVIALSLLYSAFLAEIFRSALQAVPKGQREAGLALGMGVPRIFVKVTLPQAAKIALPNIGSMFIGMIKDTSTFTIIGLVEVVRVTQNLNSVTFQPFVLYTAAAGLYIAAAFVVDFVFRFLEALLKTPPRGPLARAVTGRKRRRIQALVERLDVTPAG